MDAGIIKNIKHHYRHILAVRTLESAEANEQFNWNLLDCMIALKASWINVTSTTVPNCFRKAGFQITDQEQTDEEQAEHPHENEAAAPDFRNIWERLRSLYGNSVPEDVNMYLLVDDTTETSAALNDEEIGEQCGR